MVPHIVRPLGAHLAMRIWASPAFVSHTPERSAARAGATARRASAVPATATKRVIGKSCDEEKEQSARQRARRELIGFFSGSESRVRGAAPALPLPTECGQAPTSASIVRRPGRPDRGGGGKRG